MCHNYRIEVTEINFCNENKHLTINFCTSKKLLTNFVFVMILSKSINNDILKLVNRSTHTGSRSVYAKQLRISCIHQRVSKETFREPVFKCV